MVLIKNINIRTLKFSDVYAEILLLVCMLALTKLMNIDYGVFILCIIFLVEKYLDISNKINLKSIKECYSRIIKINLRHYEQVILIKRIPEFKNQPTLNFRNLIKTMNVMDKTIKIPKFNNIVIGILFTLCIFSYERNIHTNYYNVILSIIFTLGVILLVFNIMNPYFNRLFYAQLMRNNAVHLMAVMLLASSFFSSLGLSLLNFRNFLFTIMLILSLYIFYLFIPLLIKSNLNKVLDLILLFISLTSMIGILVHIKGSFLGYYSMYGRTASFMFDPNYFGSFAAIGVVLGMKKNKKSLFLSLINVTGLYLSGSRGAMLSLAMSLIIGYMFLKRKRIKKIIVFILIIGLLFGALSFLNNIGFFRNYQGTSGRDTLWQKSFMLIKKQPFWGYGNFSSEFRKLNINNSSSHNGLIDFALKYGLISLFVYVAIITKSFFLGVKNNIPVRMLLAITLLSVNMNTIVISLGGIGGLSFIYTVFLGSSIIYEPIANDRKFE